jgi:hypothetical protein
MLKNAVDLTSLPNTYVIMLASLNQLIVQLSRNRANSACYASAIGRVLQKCRINNDCVLH